MENEKKSGGDKYSKLGGTSPGRGGKSGTTVFLALLLGELQSEAERFCPKVYRKLLGVCTFRGK